MSHCDRQSLKALARFRGFGAVWITAQDFPPACAVIIELFLDLIEDKLDALTVVAVKPAIVYEVAMEGCAPGLHLAFCETPCGLAREPRGCFLRRFAQEQQDFGSQARFWKEVEKNSRALDEIKAFRASYEPQQ